MKELNAFIPYLPCLKQRKGSLDAMPQMDKPFS
jgi:hypothetical protein